MRHLFGDTAALTGRSLRHILRSPDTILTTAIMPVGIMLLFVYVLGGAIAPESGSYVGYQLPGVLLITVATGVSYTAYRLATDIKSGLFERFRSLPIRRSATLWAHVLTTLVSTGASLAIVTGVALLMRFRSDAGFLDWLAVTTILLVFTLALAWVAVLAGLAAKTVDGAAAFSYPLIFLPFVSSAFVPTETMPAPVRVFADHQPVTPIVNTIRALYTGQPVDAEIWVALAWCIGILCAAYIGSMALYRRRST